MIDKINFSKIVCSHFSCLKDSADRVSFGDYALFIGLPLLLSLILNYLDLELTPDFTNILVTSSSIFAGLLLNLLMLLYSLIVRFQDKKSEYDASNLAGSDPVKDEKDRIRYNVLKETFHNVSFCVLISVIVVILCLLHNIHMMYLKFLISYSVYFLVPLMILTILMILKRVHSLISNEL
jgi:hypothetical protein